MTTRNLSAISLLKRRTFKKVLALVLVLAFIPIQQNLAEANSATEVASGSGQLFGFDFELGTQHLANLVPYFDIERLESRLRIDPRTWNGVLEDGILDDYITYPGVLESLPEGDLKRSLVEGLSLKPELIETDVPAPQLILPDYMKPKATPVPRMVKTESGILAPRDVRPADPTGGRAFEISGTGFELPKGTDWALLARRWKALPKDERAKLIALRHVPARVIADVIETRIPAETKSTSALEVYLRPKSDAPKWMHEVSYSFDGATRPQDAFDGRGPSRSRQRLSVEIAMKEPEKDLGVFEAKLDEVGKATGLKTQLQVPQQMKRSNAATHIHFSVEGIDAKKMQTVMEGYRRLQMLRLLDAGDQYDPVLEFPVGDRGFMLQNIYDRPIRDKHTLIRQVSPNRYELKEHAKDVKSELREAISLVTGDEQVSSEKMRSEVRQILKKNPKIIERIKHYNPYILGDFRDVLPQAEIDEAIEARFRQAMKSSDRQVVRAHVARILKDESRIEEVWKVIKRVLDDNPSDLVWTAINEQMRFSSGRRDQGVFRLYADYLMSRPDRMDVSGYMSLRAMGALAESDEIRIVEAISARLKSQNPDERRKALYSLREVLLGPSGQGKPASREVSEAAVSALKSALPTISSMESYDRVVAQAILVKVDPQHEVPSAIAADVKVSMMYPNATIREHALQLAEKLEPDVFGLNVCGEASYREHCETVWRSYNRPEAVKAMKAFAEDRPGDLIRYATGFQSHGSRYLMNYVDIYERPGVLEEAERIIGLGDTTRSLRLLGSDGFAPLFRPRSVEVYERLRTAVEKAGDSILTKQFYEQAPRYLEAQLKKEGRWTSEIAKRLGAADVGTGECSILWAKIQRILRH